jgi:hypothetical protein
MGAGDTMYLRGGTYSGQWVSNLDGGTVRSYCAKFGPCLPSDPEWAVIDGYYTGTLERAITPAATSIPLTGSLQLQPAQVVRLGSEEIRITSGKAPTYTVVRGWGGTAATTHAAGSAFYVFGNQLEINGSNTIYRDFEIRDSNPRREYAVAGYGGYFRGGEGIFNFCADCKFVNLVLHDNADGFFESETAKRTEIYGCLIFNNGHVSSDRPHGHGLYLQNETGGTKYVKDVISLNNHALGLKIYGASEGNANDFSITGYVGFNNGSPGYYPGNPTGLKDRRYGNLEVGTDKYPSNNIAISQTYIYHPPGNTIEIPGYSLGRLPSGGNVGISITDSYVVEPGDLLTVDQWRGIIVSGNTIVTNNRGGGDFLARAIAPSGSVIWDNNAYYDVTGTKNCAGGSFQAAFQRVGFKGACGQSLRWEDWKAQTGYDANSTRSMSAPTQQAVIVRSNAYEPGRNHIVVYNFTNATSFAFTPQGLTIGQAYTIYDAQNWGTVYQSGTYNGGTITVRLSSSASVRAPTGASFTPATTQPAFAVFILIPGAARAGK